MTIDETPEPRRSLGRSLEGVAGWLWPEEAWRLHEAARRTAGPQRQATIVEIGSFEGRSTIALASGLRAAGADGTVYAIDPQEDEAFERLCANLVRAGVRELVEPVRATSHEAKARFAGRRLDVLFVDGSHEYEDVLRDLEWTGLVRRGGVVAFNDPFWPGVRRALRRRVAVQGSPLRRATFADNTVLFRHLPNEAWGVGDRRRLLALRIVLCLGALWHRYLIPLQDTERLPRALKVALFGSAATVVLRSFAAMLPTKGFFRESAPKAQALDTAPTPPPSP